MPILSCHTSAYIMNPYVRTILFFHPILDYILASSFQLSGDRFVHRLSVIRMHAVRNQAFNIIYKVFFICITQIFEHASVNKIKRKTISHVSAHHAACQRII